MAEWIRLRSSRAEDRESRLPQELHFFSLSSLSLKGFVTLKANCLFSLFFQKPLRPREYQVKKLSLRQPALGCTFLFRVLICHQEGKLLIEAPIFTSTLLSHCQPERFILFKKHNCLWNTVGEVFWKTRYSNSNTLQNYLSIIVGKISFTFFCFP